MPNRVAAFLGTCGGHGFTGGNIVNRRYPDVLYTIQWSDVADLRSIRANSALAQVGVIKKRLPRNQLKIFEHLCDRLGLWLDSGVRPTAREQKYSHQADDLVVVHFLNLSVLVNSSNAA